MSIARFLNPSDNEVYQRLLTLQESYQEQQALLDDIEKKDEQLFIKRPSIPYPRKNKTMSLDAEQLAICLKQVILRHGGVCHTETLVEYVQNFWPSAKMPDGTLLTLEDLKSEILEVLSEYSSLFYEESNGWAVETLEGEIENEKYCVPLVEKIIQIIEDVDGSATLDFIVGQVQKEWVTPMYRGKQDSPEEVRKAVSVILETNPKFRYDTKNPERYCVPLSKKRKSSSQNIKGKEDSPMDSDNDLSGPPPGFACSCGATTPGKTATAKWRIDANGQFKCISCYGKNKRYNPKGNVKKKRKVNSEPESGPWIQCDKCHSWVMAHLDNIKDLSIYDDSNPNHLDYFCPDCRKQEPQRKSRRRSARNGRD